jgi:hypothetical protein
MSNITKDWKWTMYGDQYYFWDPSNPTNAVRVGTKDPAHKEIFDGIYGGQHEGAYIPSGEVPQEVNTAINTYAKPFQGLPAPGSGSSTQATQQIDQNFDEWLAKQNLSDDEAAAITAIYNAIGANDLEKANQILAGIEAGKTFSEPYFAAKSSLLKDALTRGMQEIDGDLAFKETSLSNTLKDLKANLERSGQHLSFQHMQEMKDLERKLTQDIEVTQADMAARGFTSSSIRTRKENLIEDVYGDLRESSNKNFQFNMANNQQQITSAQRDTALEVARLKELAAAGKIDLLRSAEEQLGTEALQQMGYGNTLGNIGGELPRAQLQDAISFANANVF